MGWLNKAKSSPVGVWPVAKVIPKPDEQEVLPIGWYAYQSEYVWYGLKPNPQNTSLIRSYPFRNLEDLQQWLEIPLPEEILRAAPASSLESLVKETNTVSPPSTEPVAVPEPAESSAPEKTGPILTPVGENRTRNKQLIFRLSDSEYLRFRRRLAATGLSQTEFMRKACLEGKIVVEQDRADTVLILDMLTVIERELGRQGGMLKMLIKPNLGMRELAPEEWRELQDAIRYFEHTKKRLEELKEKI